MKEFQVRYNYKNCFGETYQNSYLLNVESKKAAINDVKNLCDHNGLTLLDVHIREIKKEAKTNGTA